MQACKDLGVTLVAYSPLTQGLLSGKYTQQNKPTGPRALIFDNDKIARIQPLLSLMRDIGEGHGGKTQTQVSLIYEYVYICIYPSHFILYTTSVSVHTHTSSCHVSFRMPDFFPTITSKLTDCWSDASQL